jgi:hypothetical protein
MLRHELLHSVVTQYDRSFGLVPYSSNAPTLERLRRWSTKKVSPRRETLADEKIHREAVTSAVIAEVAQCSVGGRHTERGRWKILNRAPSRRR